LRDQKKTEIYLTLEAIQEEENLKYLASQQKQLELQKEQMVTTAPYGGTVVEFNAFAGDLVNAGQNILRLISHGRYIVMELTEEDYFGVKDGQSVTIRLASYPDQTFEGTVVRLEDAANAGNKTRNVIVTVNVADTIMVPGLTGEGYLIKGERENAVLIPRRALIGNLVYVVSGGQVEVRRVQPGYLGLNKAEILEGIELGDLVILENQNLLQEGDLVETKDLPFNP
jgi:RND family efflux transporter MFP subunit